MSSRRKLPSVAVPIVLGAVTVPITTALLVGWTVLLGKKIGQQELGTDIVLLVLGAVAFTAIIVVLVLLSIFLVREIREVRRQDGFIDSVTHELKSPLASLKLCLETLGRSNLAPEQREKLRGMMLHDVDRLTAFIDDVLQASRLAHESTTTNLDEVDVGAVASSCAVSVAHRHSVHEGCIHVDVPAGTRVITDAIAFEIALKNLIDNAVKYSGDDVRVDVSARFDPAQRRLNVAVKDHGIGIARSDLKRVFDRFYRVDDENVRQRKGTGLGLFVVSALVKNIGGRTSAESDGPGKGTTMRMIIPANGASDGRAIAGPS
jgi:signal transduction histidine kinase